MPTLVELMFSTGCGVNHWRTESWAVITIGNVTTTMALLYSKIKTKIILVAKLSSTCVWCNSLSYFARIADFYVKIPIIREHQILSVFVSIVPYQLVQ